VDGNVPFSPSENVGKLPLISQQFSADASAPELYRFGANASNDVFIKGLFFSALCWLLMIDSGLKNLSLYCWLLRAHVCECSP